MNDQGPFVTLPAVTRRTLVVDAMREAIISGRLPPGTKVTELDLAARFGVSRGPIREAIRELIDEGLLVSRPYSGTNVCRVDERTIVEAYSLRRVLEVYAFSLVWPRRDARFETELRARHDALLRALDGRGAYDEIRAEMAFHSMPYEFSGSDLLCSTWRQVAQRIQLGFSVYQVARGGPVRPEHERYLELALGDDFAALKTEVERHIDQGLDGVQSFFRKRRECDPADLPDWTPSAGNP